MTSVLVEAEGRCIGDQAYQFIHVALSMLPGGPLPRQHRAARGGWCTKMASVDDRTRRDLVVVGLRSWSIVPAIRRDFRDHANVVIVRPLTDWGENVPILELLIGRVVALDSRACVAKFEDGVTVLYKSALGGALDTDDDDAFDAALPRGDLLIADTTHPRAIRTSLVMRTVWTRCDLAIVGATLWHVDHECGGCHCRVANRLVEATLDSDEGNRDNGGGGGIDVDDDGRVEALRRPRHEATTKAWRSDAIPADAECVACTCATTGIARWECWRCTTVACAPCVARIAGRRVTCTWTCPSCRLETGLDRIHVNVRGARKGRTPYRRANEGARAFHRLVGDAMRWMGVTRTTVAIQSHLDVLMTQHVRFERDDSLRGAILAHPSDADHFPRCNIVFQRLDWALAEADAIMVGEAPVLARSGCLMDRDVARGRVYTRDRLDDTWRESEGAFGAYAARGMGGVHSVLDDVREGDVKKFLDHVDAQTFAGEDASDASSTEGSQEADDARMLQERRDSPDVEWCMGGVLEHSVW